MEKLSPSTRVFAFTGGTNTENESSPGVNILDHNLVLDKDFSWK